MLSVPVGDVYVATQTGEVNVGTNVPAHVVPIIIWSIWTFRRNITRVGILTFRIVVTGYKTLRISCVGATVLGTSSMTSL